MQACISLPSQKTMLSGAFSVHLQLDNTDQPHLMMLGLKCALSRDCLVTQRAVFQEDYDNLTTKTLSFLRAAVTAWDAEYIVKVRHYKVLHRCVTAFAQELSGTGQTEGVRIVAAGR